MDLQYSPYPVPIAIVVLRPSMPELLFFPGQITGAGDITVNAGKLTISGSCANVQTVNVNNTGQLEINVGTTSSAFNNSTLSLTVNPTSINNNGILTFNISGLCTSNYIMNGTGSLVVNDSGSGILTLKNAAHTGSTTIGFGTLIGDISNSVGVIVNGTYDMNGVASTLINLSGSGTIMSSTSAKTLTLLMKGNTTFTGTFGNTIGGITLAGNGVFTFSGINNMLSTAPVILNSGTFNMSAANNFGALTLAGGILQNRQSMTLSQAITLSAPSTINTASNTILTISQINGSTNALTKMGSGTLVLSGTNTFSSTILQEGTLVISTAGSLATVSNTLTLEAGTTLRASANLTLNQTIIMNGDCTIDPNGFNLTLNSFTLSNPTGSSTYNLTIGNGTLIEKGTLIANGVNLSSKLIDPSRTINLSPQI